MMSEGRPTNLLADVLRRLRPRYVASALAEFDGL